MGLVLPGVLIKPKGGGEGRVVFGELPNYYDKCLALHQM